MSLVGLVIGDPHFSLSNIKEVDTFIEKSVRAVRLFKPDFVVCAGDCLDSHEKCHMEPFIRAMRFLSELAKHTPTFLTVGNHDRKNNSDFMSDDHFFTGLKHCPNLTIVDKAIKQEIVSKKDPTVKGNFLFVPYVYPGRFYEALDTIDLSEFEDTWRSPYIDAIFCHQEFRGVQMGPFKSEIGDIWDVSWPLVISGHIHEYQVLQSNMIYVGTPMQHTFSEKLDKAIVMFNFNIKYLEEANITLEEVSSLEALVPDPLMRARYARIKLDLCVKRTVTLTVSQVAGFRPPPNEKTRVIIRGTASEIRALTKSKGLDRLTKLGVKFSTIPIEEVKTQASGSAELIKPKKFIARFRELIAEDQDLLPVFDSLFARVELV
jgi:DNA repair exonuclease SbcCD nuclease subunit